MSPRPSDPTLRVKLLVAAEAEFVARGLERTKVERITARAGTSKGSFYLHFAGKEDAFRELVENMLARLASFLDGCDADCAEEEVGAFVDSRVNEDVQMFEFIWQNRALMRMMVDLGALFGIDVVAEGIEREDQLAALRELGCGMGQGYLLGRPVELQNAPRAPRAAAFSA